MPKVRFFKEDVFGNTELISSYDTETGITTYYADEAVIAEQRDKNMKRAGTAASDIAMQDPKSPLFNL